LLLKGRFVMYFDGKVGQSKHRAPLGARNIAKSKQDLLLESQKLREQREVERKRHLTATRIQRHIRRYLLETHQVQGLYNDWIERFRLQALPPSSPVVRELLQWVLQITFWFHRCQRYDEWNTRKKQRVIFTSENSPMSRWQVLQAVQQWVLEATVSTATNLWTASTISAVPPSLLSASSSLLLQDIRVQRLWALVALVLRESHSSASSSSALFLQHFFAELFASPIMNMNTTMMPPATPNVMGLLCIVLVGSKSLIQTVKAWATIAPVSATATPLVATLLPLLHLLFAATFPPILEHDVQVTIFTLVTL
jgi:hypothetical protein